ncbi:MAG: methionine--tRNA ligase, partial [Spirochaetota bacterium]|nr:methionine--tRNA ligase [Spirochaetota bacterium]
FFTQLLKNGYISEKTIQQYYCTNDRMFLPDRFLEGTCPECKYEKARGDECTKCGKWLEPEKLIDAKCKICYKSPVMKETNHWFLRLDLLQDKLKLWLDKKTNLKENVRHFALGWFKEGLNERAITRDLTWGVPVPLENAKGKVLYVWFDAPIGYISSTIEWSEKIGDPDKWKDYWFNKDCKLIHFIGKDNVPFHVIVWPAILMGQDSNYILPYDVPANEHLTIEGKKLSTSEGNVIWVDDYLKHFSCDSLRYYLASMAPETKDSNFSWKSFQEKNNNELNNILGNFVNRTFTFIKNNFNNIIPHAESYTESDNDSLSVIKSYPEKVASLLSQFKVREAIFDVIQLAHLGNRYFDFQSPWKVIKSDQKRCSTILNICALMIKTIAPILYPFLPDSSEKLWIMLGEKEPLNKIKWDSIKDFTIEANTKLGKINLLFNKIDDKIIDKLTDEFHKSIMNQEKEQKKEINIDDFNNIDLKIGTVLEGEKLQKSNKLLKLKVKIGNETRQIISGVANYYNPEDLLGKQVLVITNLKKVTLMGEISEGMILFADDNGKLTLVSPINSVQDGSKVK